ncbi:probable glucosamine 6-phosphate N-acetyltransferase isoform X1 [Centruroides sculpturatus]|uniref:probable glucosamine 6-phosphate N-acetyltransferase isoform X1 n=2 Tax=Centruroides sculpturatus TaxID=218467 RepID=UPI000C6CF27F|nr:probable glucosamine 6-phosphate N-acetyltransferase isoform X1 [Centruroides sculpturatus]
MESEAKRNGICNENQEYLYSMEILKMVDLEKGKAKFNPPLTVLNPGENLKMRPLSVGDYDKGFIYLLSQLTKVGNVSHEDFLRRFYSMKGCPDSYYVTVIEDIKKNRIVGSATLFIEKKFIRQTGLRGRLEDVVVSNEYRGKQLGKLLVESMRQLAEHLGCYKVTLDCRDQMVKFYSELGFALEPGNSNVMTLRFHE